MCGSWLILLIRGSDVHAVGARVANNATRSMSSHEDSFFRTFVTEDKVGKLFSNDNDDDDDEHQQQAQYQPY